MKKQELIDTISRSAGVPRATVKAVLDAAAGAARATLATGSPVMLFGLGKLHVSARGAKVARDLRTGERVMVPPRKVAVYRPSVSVDDAVNNRSSAASESQED